MEKVIFTIASKTKATKTNQDQIDALKTFRTLSGSN